MLRELLLCAAVIVCGSPLHHVAAVVHNAHSPSSIPSKAGGVHKSGHAHHQNSPASASQSSYQSAVSSTRYQTTPKPSYEVNSAVVNSISEPVTAKSVSVQSYGSQNVNQATAFYSASDPSSPETYNIPLTYADNAAPITPYYSVPIAPKTVTIESQGNRPAGYAAYSQNVVPSVQYVSNVAPSNPYYATPVAARTITVQSQAPQNPAIAYASYASSARDNYPVPVAGNTVTIQSHGATPSPAVGTYSVNQAVNPSSIQYVPVQYVQSFAGPSIPVAPKTVEVTPRPRIASQYAPNPARLVYAPAPAANPISVPVIYQASTVGTQQSAPQQYAYVKTVAPTASTYAQAPERVQYTSVPVEYPTAANGVRYNPVPVPIVHADSFVEKVYSPVRATPTPVAPAGPYYGYARAAAFSPASAVSRVTFNGLGASYVY